MPFPFIIEEKVSCGDDSYSIDSDLGQLERDALVSPPMRIGSDEVEDPFSDTGPPLRGASGSVALTQTSNMEESPPSYKSRNST